MKIDKKTLAEVVKISPLATSFFVTKDGHYFTNKNKSFAINYCATSGQEMVEVDLEGNQINAEDIAEVASDANYKIIQMNPNASPATNADSETAKLEAEAKELADAELLKVTATTNMEKTIAKANATAKAAAAPTPKKSK